MIIAWVTGLLEGEGTFHMSGRSTTLRVRMIDRDTLNLWKRQGHGVGGGQIADAIVLYREADDSQADIMELFKVGKSTVYRHTKNYVRRMRVTARRPILLATTRNGP